MRFGSLRLAAVWLPALCGLAACSGSLLPHMPNPFMVPFAAAAVAALVFTFMAGLLAVPAPTMPFVFIGAWIGAGASVSVTMVCALYADVGSVSSDNAMRRVAPHAVLAMACAVTVLVVSAITPW